MVHPNEFTDRLVTEWTGQWAISTILGYLIDRFA
jgi:hypothetical protein